MMCFFYKLKNNIEVEILSLCCSKSNKRRPTTLYTRRQLSLVKRSGFQGRVGSLLSAFSVVFSTIPKAKNKVSKQDCNESDEGRDEERDGVVIKGNENNCLHSYIN